MATVPPPRRGRPARHPVDVLRTQLWFQVVKLCSGLPSAYALEEAIEGRPTGDQVWRPRKWDAYEDGRKVPSTAIGRTDAVALAEQRYPGTAAWFHSPLWTVLRGPALDPFAIERALRALDQAVVDTLFQWRQLAQDEPATRQPRLLERGDVEALSALGTFDALVAVVLLIQQSEAIASPELREWALEAYAALQPAIADAPQTCRLYPELFTYIDRACLHWIYVAPNHRLQMHVFWHERARRSWGGDRMPFIDERIRALRAAEDLDHGWPASQD